MIYLLYHDNFFSILTQTAPHKEKVVNKSHIKGTKNSYGITIRETTIKRVTAQKFSIRIWSEVKTRQVIECFSFSCYCCFNSLCKYIYLTKYKPAKDDYMYDIFDYYHYYYYLVLS